MPTAEMRQMARATCEPSDPRLAAYRDVGDPAGLEHAGLFVAEGRFVVERLLDDRRFEVVSVAVTPAGALALNALFDRHPDVPVLVCDPSVLESVTGFYFHRGCLALARRPVAALPLSTLAGASRLIALEGVGNPDNVGGLFRAALALGAGGVLLDRASADPLYRKAIRTSMAASLRVPFTRVEPWPSALDELKAAGFQVIALTPDAAAPAIDDYAAAPDSRLILALGSEGPGLRAEMMRYADLRLRIAVDPRADSLNVVVAAAIALNALRPKHHTPNANAKSRMADARTQA
jgi:tRNA G18 (ribose-2'-O)-methylase SpoU